MSPRNRSAAARLAVVGLGLLLAAPAAGVSLGLLDDFQSGTAGWSTGAPHPAPPALVLDAGPGGLGDHALQLTASGGNGPGSRLGAFNTAQWTGDYTGISAITLSVNNLGAEDVVLRLLFQGASGDFSSVGFGVGAGSGWQQLMFPILPGELVSVGGVDPAATLAAVSRLRLWHAPAATNSQPPAVEAILRVDDIRAVPEPGTALLLGAGLAGLASAGRRRTHTS